MNGLPALLFAMRPCNLSPHATSCLPLPLTSSHLMLAPTPHIFFTEPHALIGSWKGAPHARQHPIL